MSSPRRPQASSDPNLHSRVLSQATWEEEERCEEDPECHSSAKRARVCATFTDSQEVSIVEFVKLHPELYDKEYSRFHDRTRREALWAEISAELKLQSFDVRRWFESHYEPVMESCLSSNLASSSTQAAASSSFVYYTPSRIGFSNPTSVLTVQDEGSRHNLSGILSQLPDLTSTQIVEQPQQQQQPQQQLFTITTLAPPQQQQQPPQ